MTVKELIEKLSALNPETHVFCVADEDGEVAEHVFVSASKEDFPYLKSGARGDWFEDDEEVVVIGAGFRWAWKRMNEAEKANGRRRSRRR